MIQILNHFTRLLKNGGGISIHAPRPIGAGKQYRLQRRIAGLIPIQLNRVLLGFIFPFIGNTVDLLIIRIKPVFIVLNLWFQPIPGDLMAQIIQFIENLLLFAIRPGASGLNLNTAA